MQGFVTQLKLAVGLICIANAAGVTSPTTSPTSTVTSTATLTPITSATSTATTSLTTTATTTTTTCECIQSTQTTTPSSTQTTTPSSTQTTTPSSTQTTTPTTSVTSSVTLSATSSPTTTISSTQTSSVTTSPSTSRTTSQTTSATTSATSSITSTITSSLTTTPTTSVSSSATTSVSTSPSTSITSTSTTSRTSSATTSATSSLTTTVSSTPTTSLSTTPTTTRTSSPTTSPTTSPSTTQTSSQTTTGTWSSTTSPTTSATTSSTTTPTTTDLVLNVALKDAQENEINNMAENLNATVLLPRGKNIEDIIGSFSVSNTGSSNIKMESLELNVTLSEPSGANIVDGGSVELPLGKKIETVISEFTAGMTGSGILSWGVTTISGIEVKVAPNKRSVALLGTPNDLPGTSLMIEVVATDLITTETKLFTITVNMGSNDLAIELTQNADDKQLTVEGGSTLDLPAGDSIESLINNFTVGTTGSGSIRWSTSAIAGVTATGEDTTEFRLAGFPKVPPGTVLAIEVACFDTVTYEVATFLVKVRLAHTKLAISLSQIGKTGNLDVVEGTQLDLSAGAAIESLINNFTIGATGSGIVRWSVTDISGVMATPGADSIEFQLSGIPTDPFGSRLTIKVDAVDIVTTETASFTFFVILTHQSLSISLSKLTSTGPVAVKSEETLTLPLGDAIETLLAGFTVNSTGSGVIRWSASNIDGVKFVASNDTTEWKPAGRPKYRPGSLISVDVAAVDTVTQETAIFAIVVQMVSIELNVTSTEAPIVENRSSLILSKGKDLKDLIGSFGVERSGSGVLRWTATAISGVTSRVTGSAEGLSDKFELLGKPDAPPGTILEIEIVAVDIITKELVTFQLTVTMATPPLSITKEDGNPNIAIKKGKRGDSGFFTVGETGSGYLDWSYSPIIEGIIQTSPETTGQAKGISNKRFKFEGVPNATLHPPGSIIPVVITAVDLITYEQAKFFIEIELETPKLSIQSSKLSTGVSDGGVVELSVGTAIESVLGTFSPGGTGSGDLEWQTTKLKEVRGVVAGDAVDGRVTDFKLVGIPDYRAGTELLVSVTAFDKVTAEHASLTFMVKIQRLPLVLTSTNPAVTDGYVFSIDEGGALEGLGAFAVYGGSGLYRWSVSATPASMLNSSAPAEVLGRESPKGGEWSVNDVGDRYILSGIIEEHAGTIIGLVVRVVDTVTSVEEGWTIALAVNREVCRDESEITIRNAHLSDCIEDRETGHSCTAVCDDKFAGFSRPYVCDGKKRKMVPAHDPIECEPQKCPVPTRFNSGLDRFGTLDEGKSCDAAVSDDVCNAKCLNGFEQVSSAPLVCQPDGTWVGYLHCVPIMTFRTTDGAYFEGPVMLENNVVYDGGTDTNFAAAPSGALRSYKVSTAELASDSAGIEVQIKTAAASARPGADDDGEGIAVARIKFDITSEKLALTSKTAAANALKAVGEQLTTVKLQSSLENVVFPFVVTGGSGRYSWQARGAPEPGFNLFQYSTFASADETATGIEVGVPTASDGNSEWQDEPNSCFGPKGCIAIRISNELRGDKKKTYIISAVVVDQLFGLTQTLSIELQSAEAVQSEVDTDVTEDETYKGGASGYRITENGYFSAVLKANGIDDDLPRRCKLNKLSASDVLFNKERNDADFFETAAAWGYEGLENTGLVLNGAKCELVGTVAVFDRGVNETVTKFRTRRVEVKIDVLATKDSDPTDPKSPIKTLKETNPITGESEDVPQTAIAKFDLLVYPRVRVEVSRILTRENASDPSSAELLNTGEDFTAIIDVTGGNEPYLFDPEQTFLPPGLEVQQLFLVRGAPINATYGPIDRTKFIAGKPLVEALNFHVGFKDNFGAAERSADLPYKIGKPDCDDPTNGPGGRGCDSDHGTCIDFKPFTGGEEGEHDIPGRFDNAFTCRCSDKYEGDTCSSPPFDPTATIAGGVSGSIILIIAIGLSYILYQRRLLARPHDFDAELAKMVAKGLIKASSVDGERRVPKELKRDSVLMIERLGAGAFGDVNKGLYDPQEPGMPEYPVAIKVLKENAGREEIDDLMKEATVTAQFLNDHVVMLVGVVTSGEPHMIVLQLCEKGAVNSLVKNAKPPIDNKTKLKYCYHISLGMEYLAKLGFVHRDLAARNVLVDAKDFAKIADFGLSRDTEDDEYYVAKAGKVPIRWTAPEALTSRKFSEFSDVWGYGITCVEIWTNAETPYKGWMNAFVMEQVLDSYKLPCPETCPPKFYNRVISRCLEFEAKSRLRFAAVVLSIEPLLDDADCLVVNDDGTYATGADNINDIGRSEALAKPVDGADNGSGELWTEEEGLKCDLFESQKYRSEYCKNCYFQSGAPGPHKDMSYDEEEQYGGFAISREKEKISWNHGVVSEEEAQKRLRQRRGTSDEMTMTFMERKSFLLREVDKFTFVLSVLTNGRYGHHVLELGDDRNFRERDADHSLGKSLAKAARGIIASVGLSNAKPVECGAADKKKTAASSAVRRISALWENQSGSNLAYQESSIGAIDKAEPPGASDDWWAGKMGKASVANSILQGGPGSYMIRASTKEDQLILCVNDNMKNVNYPITVSADRKVVTFAGNTFEGVTALIEHLRQNPLESKRGGGNIKITSPGPGGVLAPWMQGVQHPTAAASATAGEIFAKTAMAARGTEKAAQKFVSGIGAALTELDGAPPRATAKVTSYLNQGTENTVDSEDEYSTMSHGGNSDKAKKSGLSETNMDAAVSKYGHDAGYTEKSDNSSSVSDLLQAATASWEVSAGDESRVRTTSLPVPSIEYEEGPGLQGNIDNRETLWTDNLKAARNSNTNAAKPDYVYDGKVLSQAEKIATLRRGSIDNYANPDEKVEGFGDAEEDAYAATLRRASTSPEVTSGFYNADEADSDGYAIPDEEVLTKRILQKTEDKPPQKNRETNMFGSKKKKKVKKGKEVGNSDERCPTCSAKLAYCICNADSRERAASISRQARKSISRKVSTSGGQVVAATSTDLYYDADAVSQEKNQGIEVERGENLLSI